MADKALNPRFALQRSYIKGVGFYAPAGSVKVLAGTTATILWPPIGTGVAVAAVMKPEWFAWNSNTYTPDWIYSEYYAYFQNAPSVHYTYLPFTSFAHEAPDGNAWYLTNHLDFSGDFYYFDLPAAPGTYWLPPL